jgi:hypothetical protein
LVDLLGAVWIGWHAHGAAHADRIAESIRLGAMSGPGQTPLSRVKTI